MLGGLYGDLAADTYLRDPNIFYERLFDDKAVLSEYGLSILATYKFVTQAKSKTDDRREMFDIARRMITEADYKVASVSDRAKAWANECFAMCYPTASGMYLNRLATFYGISDTVANEGWAIADIHSDKAEGYANIFMGEIIRSLRNGLSKDETYAQMNPIFKDCRRNWNWKELEDPISLLIRAWDCFYNSFDFGSAIHNAVRYPNSYTRQIASLTGLLAEAMYGCTVYHKKKQFGNIYTLLELPQTIRQAYNGFLRSIMLLYPKSRNFYRKNDSCTNVERHHYHTITSEYRTLSLSYSQYKHLLYGYDTNDDIRVGIYLDDGWLYLHYGYDIIGRLKFKLNGDKYFISDIQSTEGYNEGKVDVALKIVLNHCSIKI